MSVFFPPDDRGTDVDRQDHRDNEQGHYSKVHQIFHSTISFHVFIEGIKNVFYGFVTIFYEHLRHL